MEIGTTGRASENKQAVVKGRKNDAKDLPTAF